MRKEKSIRLMSVILSLLMFVSLLSALAACESGGTEDTSSGAVSEDVTTQSPEKTDAITFEDLNKYRMIRPDSYEGSDSAQIAQFFTEFKKKTGCSSVEIGTDFYKEGIAQFEIGEYEILIGDTNREESASFLKDLRIDDYGYALIGKKLLIAGRTVQGTMNALSAFSDRVLRGLNTAESVFYASSADYVKKFDYDVDKLSVGGVDIGEFVIVYDSENRNGEKNTAKVLGNAISSVSGIVLDVYPDSDVPEDRKHRLVIGSTGSAEITLAFDQAFVGYPDGNVYFGGSDSTAINHAVSRFTSQFTEGQKDTVDVTLKTDDVFSFDRTVVSAMSFNVLVSNKTNARTERVLTIIKNYLPDTIGFQETNPAWMSDLKKGLSSEYAYVGEGRDGGDSGEYNPIFYKKSIFNCLESGTRWLSASPKSVSKYPESSLNRIYTYALLERKADGLKIMVVNTHFDHKSEEARDKQAKVLAAFLSEQLSYPLILTGDFNTTSSTSCYRTVIGTGVADSSSSAKERHTAATFTNYGASNKIIDFVFVNPLKITVNSYKVCNEKIDGDWPSDHHPVFIEYVPSP